MTAQPNNDALEALPRELHLHASGPAFWVGIVCLDGVKQPEIGPMPLIKYIEREAEKRNCPGLESFVWAQDEGMIISEGRSRSPRLTQ